MEGVFESSSTYMINTRGRLVSVQTSEVPARKTDGWRIVLNPKRSYFPEYDIEGKHNQNNLNGDLLDEGFENEDALPFEDV